MELALFVYLAGVVGNVGGVFVAIAIISAIIMFICGVSAVCDDDKSFIKPFYISLCTLLFSAFTAALLPSEKTMYLMAGAYTTQAVAQSTVGQKTVELIEQKLDEELAKLKEKK